MERGKPHERETQILVGELEPVSYTHLDVYKRQFENSFGRTLSAMDYEIINAWIDKGFSEELVIEMCIRDRNISASQENFAHGLGNRTGSTTASAMLTANNATNTATRNYNLYLDIKNNGFTRCV